MKKNGKNMLKKLLKIQNLVNLVIFQLKKSLNCLIGKIQKVKQNVALCVLGATLFPFSLQTTKRAFITTRTAPQFFYFFRI